MGKRKAGSFNATASFNGSASNTNNTQNPNNTLELEIESLRQKNDVITQEYANLLIQHGECGKKNIIRKGEILELRTKLNHANQQITNLNLHNQVKITEFMKIFTEHLIKILTIPVVPETPRSSEENEGSLSEEPNNEENINCEENGEETDNEENVGSEDSIPANLDENNGLSNIEEENSKQLNDSMCNSSSVPANFEEKNQLSNIFEDTEIDINNSRRSTIINTKNSLNKSDNEDFDNEESGNKDSDNEDSNNKDSDNEDPDNDKSSPNISTSVLASRSLNRIENDLDDLDFSDVKPFKRRNIREILSESFDDSSNEPSISSLKLQLSDVTNSKTMSPNLNKTSFQMEPSQMENLSMLSAKFLTSTPFPSICTRTRSKNMSQNDETSNLSTNQSHSMTRSKNLSQNLEISNLSANQSHTIINSSTISKKTITKPVKNKLEEKRKLKVVLDKINVRQILNEIEENSLTRIVKRKNISAKFQPKNNDETVVEINKKNSVTKRKNTSKKLKTEINDETLKEIDKENVITKRKNISKKSEAVEENIVTKKINSSSKKRPDSPVRLPSPPKRPKRAAKPGSMKEPTLNSKMRRN